MGDVTCFSATLIDDEGYYITKTTKKQREFLLKFLSKPIEFTLGKEEVKIELSDIEFRERKRISSDSDKYEDAIDVEAELSANSNVDLNYIARGIEKEFNQYIKDNKSKYVVYLNHFEVYEEYEGEDSSSSSEIPGDDGYKFYAEIKDKDDEYITKLSKKQEKELKKYFSSPIKLVIDGNKLDIEIEEIEFKTIKKTIYLEADLSIITIKRLKMTSSLLKDIEKKLIMELDLVKEEKDSSVRIINIFIRTKEDDIPIKPKKSPTIPKIDEKEWNKHIKEEIKGGILVKITQKELIILLRMPLSFQDSLEFKYLTDIILKKYPKTENIKEFNLFLKTAIETYLREDIILYEDKMYTSNEAHSIIKDNWENTLLKDDIANKKIVNNFIRIVNESNNKKYLE